MPEPREVLKLEGHMPKITAQVTVETLRVDGVIHYSVKAEPEPKEYDALPGRRVVLPTIVHVGDPGVSKAACVQRVQADLQAFTIKAHMVATGAMTSDEVDVLTCASCKATVVLAGGGAPRESWEPETPRAEWRCRTCEPCPECGATNSLSLPSADCPVAVCASCGAARGP